MSNIRNARLKKGISQKEVAITLGVSAPSVSDWESGKKKPNGDNLIKLSALLGVSTDYLLGNDDTKKAPTLDEDERDDLIAMYGDVKDTLSNDDKQDIMLFMKMKAERKKERENDPDAGKGV